MTIHLLPVIVVVENGVMSAAVNGLLFRDGGLAEQVFDSLENKDSRAYAAVIQGMAKVGVGLIHCFMQTKLISIYAFVRRLKFVK